MNEPEVPANRAVVGGFRAAGDGDDMLVMRRCGSRQARGGHPPRSTWCWILIGNAVQNGINGGDTR